jgi:hypothetical protein
MADAQRAALSAKDTYKQYPARMLQMRARWWAMRDAFPDALKGIDSAEEQQERFMGDAEVVDETPPLAPRSSAEALKERLRAVKDASDEPPAQVPESQLPAALAKIEAAGDLSQLELISDELRSTPLTQEEKAEARKAFVARKKAMVDSSTKAPVGDAA